MKVLLVANYEPDRQESMLRFAEVLHGGLLALGCEAELVRPNPFFGRLSRDSRPPHKWLGYMDKFAIFPPRLWKLARRFDVIHVLDHSNAMYLPWLGGKPALSAGHDLIAVRTALGEFPGRRLGLTGRILQRWILSSLRKARWATSISEASRQDVIRLARLPPERVALIPMDLNATFAPRAQPGPVSGRYLLHVGSNAWYKNREGLLRAYGLVRAFLGRDAPKLVFAGARFGYGPDVECVENPSHEDLCALYTHAEWLVLPSLVEGFGWTLVEAQACGCPVIASHRVPMTEVSGGAASWIADPDDPESVARGILDALALPTERRAALIRAGMDNARRYTEGRMARAYLELYRRILAEP